MKNKIMKISEKLNKIMFLGLVNIILFTTSVRAEVVQEVSGGGAIQSSKLGQGLYNIVRDFIGFLQWLLPVISVLVVLFYIFKIMTGDEQDQSRYKKGLVKVGGCLLGAVSTVTIINLIMRYFT